MSGYEDWLSYLPADVRIEQLAWDRYAKAWRMRQAGMTFGEIGERLGGRSRSTGQNLARRGEWQTRAKHPFYRYSPAERWCRRFGEEFWEYKKCVEMDRGIEPVRDGMSIEWG